MTETAEKLKLELAQLSAQDRAELAYFLIHSLDGESDGDVESELTQRMNSIENGTAVGESANQVISDLRAKYS